MPRVYTRLTVVVAALSWLSNDLSFGSGMTCTRTDSNYQQVRKIVLSSGAISTGNPEGSDYTIENSVLDETSATYSKGTSASSGGSDSGGEVTMTAANSAAWGASGIGVPQVTFAMTTAMSATVDPTDAGASSGTVLEFGEDPHWCVATGTFEASSGSATGTFSGTMDIIYTQTPTGVAGIYAGGWTITCGGSELTGELSGDYSSWNVTGGYYLSGVWTDVDEVWPLETNTTLTPTEPWSLGDEFTLEIDLFDIIINVQADPTDGDAGLTAGMSFTSSASIQ